MSKLLVAFTSLLFAGAVAAAPAQYRVTEIGPGSVTVSGNPFDRTESLFLLTPVPEPGPVVLSLGGLVVLALTRRARDGIFPKVCSYKT